MLDAKICAPNQEIIDMRYTLLAGFSGLGVLLAAVPALAHHPFSAEFDAQAPLTLSGIVTKVNWANPHVYVDVDAKDPNGQTRNWTLELAGPAMLARKGWTKDSLKIGEVITMKGYRAKSEPFTTSAAFGCGCSRCLFQHPLFWPQRMVAGGENN
jgi:hypothetical protein